MRVKAVKDLAAKSDPEFFAEVAEGLGDVARNAITLDDEARFLWEHRRAQGHRIVRAVAAEEAAKFLILLDAVRCPRVPREGLHQHLGRFYDHLSKGIYVQTCDYAPATVADFEGMIARLRMNFYLDGPNDVDWIFPNHICYTRESTLYVDYVETDEGHMWVQPAHLDPMMEVGWRYHTPAVVQLVRYFDTIGIADARALEVIADTWQPVPMTPDFHRQELRELNRQTLEALRAKGLLTDTSTATCDAVVERWLFPLYSFDLSPIKVDRDDLRERQRSWLYREQGVSREG